MGVEVLRKNGMMAHLLDSLEAGQDIGHYGRLVFAMVARHFLGEDELLTYLQKNPDFSPEQARALYLQVQGKDYNPPRRERVLKWQRQQEFPLCPFVWELEILIDVAGIRIVRVSTTTSLNTTNRKPRARSHDRNPEQGERRAGLGLGHVSLIDPAYG
jgi:hypothetical protein